MFTLEAKDGADALTLNQIISYHQGFAVVSGAGGECAVTDGTNSMEVDIASGTVIHGGTELSVTATTKTLTTGGNLPRKDVIWVGTDTNGNAVVNVTEGTQAEARPKNTTQEDTYHPSPPDLVTSDAVVLAVVWVGADATDTTSGDIQDRRLLARLDNQMVDGLQNIGDSSFSAYPLDEVTDLKNVGAFPFRHGTEVDAPASAHHTKTSTLDELTDSDINDVTVDTRANLPASGNSDELYIETDADGRILRGTGTGWDPVGVPADALIEGGVDALDASDLSGAAGSNDQILKTDGTSAFWGSVGGGASTGELALILGGL